MDDRRHGRFILNLEFVKLSMYPQGLPSVKLTTLLGKSVCQLFKTLGSGVKIEKVFNAETFDLDYIRNTRSQNSLRFLK